MFLFLCPNQQKNRVYVILNFLIRFMGMVNRKSLNKIVITKTKEFIIIIRLKELIKNTW